MSPICGDALTLFNYRIMKNKKNVTGIKTDKGTKIVTYEEKEKKNKAKTNKNEGKEFIFCYWE